MQHLTLQCSPVDWKLNSNPTLTLKCALQAIQNPKLGTTGKYCDSFEFCGGGGGTVVDGGGTLVCGGSVCSDRWQEVGLIIQLTKFDQVSGKP